MQLMNGATVAFDATIFSISSAWTVAGIADFDGDRKADILWRNSVTGANIVSLMDGAASTSDTLIGALPASWPPQPVLVAR